MSTCLKTLKNSSSGVIQVPGSSKMLNGFEKTVISTSFLYDESLPGGFKTSLRQKFNIKALNFHLASLLCVLRGSRLRARRWKRNEVTHFHEQKNEGRIILAGWNDPWQAHSLGSSAPWQPSQKINFGPLTYTFCAARCVLPVTRWAMQRVEKTSQSAESLSAFLLH